jgi:hypothetical protein
VGLVKEWGAKRKAAGRPRNRVRKGGEECLKEGEKQALYS